MWYARMRKLAGKLRRWLRRVHPRHTYCALAWKHLQINPEGTAKLCCRASASVCDEKGQPMSLDTHTLDEIWNSPYLRERRRRMAVGERLPECGTCYAAEDAGCKSYRTLSNEKWLARDGLTLDEAILQARAARHGVVEPPVFYQLNLGNLCNLKCRMCSSSFSSQIEADPVHSAWAPRLRFNDSGIARWAGETLVLLPGRCRDVTGPNGAVWKGGGVFRVPVGAGDELTEMEIKLADEKTLLELQVIINGETFYRGVPVVHGWPERFNLADTDTTTGQLEVSITDMRGRPAAIAEATLRRTRSSARRAGFNNVISTRFDQPGDWHTQDSVILDEILRHTDTLQELYFTGGEPLISKKFQQILDHLIQRGVAQRLTLQLNSNLTKLSDDLLEKLAQFQHVTFTLSIDGYGDVYEYIRYPAKWSVVAENMRQLARLTNAAVCATPVVTAYNLLTLTDLFHFCDELGMRFLMANCYGPEWLQLNVLPPKAIAEAARRFLAYAERDCQPENRHTVEAMGSALRKGVIKFRPDLLPAFQAFTNELDAARRQSFARTFPELLDFLAESGHPWVAGGRVELLPLGLPTKIYDIT